MNFQTLRLQNQGTIWTLTLNRPEALNALNSLVLEELTAALNEVEKENFSQARCLILTGAGEKAFVAGADIKELGTLDEAAALRFAERGQKLFRRFENLKIPVIAAVNGFALGGGCELALACDFIYASENAKFGLPEVTLGLIPGFGGTVRLSRRVGLARAKELIFSGEMIVAGEAHRLGLVNRVVPLSELLPTVMKTAQAIDGRGPVAVAHAKSSLMRAYDQDIDTAMKTEAQEFSGLFKTQDFKEGTSAFIEKRKAQFQGR